MNTAGTRKNTYIGISLAIITTIIWSGNFIIARGVFKQIPPVSLAFYRWSLASIIIFFFGFKKFAEEKSFVLKNRKYLFWVTLMGITLFNTFIYIAGHYTSAINLALIGTTAAPVFTVIISAIFFKRNYYTVTYCRFIILYCRCVGSVIKRKYCSAPCI